MSKEAMNYMVKEGHKKTTHKYTKPKVIEINNREKGEKKIQYTPITKKNLLSIGEDEGDFNLWRLSLSGVY